jgi:fructose-1,6-bisphosphatase/inositol monophosphatase family enzyme
VRYHAVRGKGARLNDAPIRAASATEFAPNQLFVLCSRSARRGAGQLPCKARLAGSAGFDLCAVASGACVGSLDLSAHVWDIAATSVILSEAGGHMTVNPGRGRGPLFPLAPGADYADAVFAVLTACTPSLLKEAQSCLGEIVMS